MVEKKPFVEEINRYSVPSNFQDYQSEIFPTTAECDCAREFQMKGEGKK